MRLHGVARGRSRRTMGQRTTCTGDNCERRTEMRPGFKVFSMLTEDVAALPGRDGSNTLVGKEPPLHRGVALREENGGGESCLRFFVHSAQPQ